MYAKLTLFEDTRNTDAEPYSTNPTITTIFCFLVSFSQTKAYYVFHDLPPVGRGDPESIPGVDICMSYSCILL